MPMTVFEAPPIGRHHEVGGRRLWLHSSGAGGPAVVILPGASAVGLDYLNIHDRVAEFTTCVVYDRGGTGWSDPAGLPRSAGDVATELRELLGAAGVAGPYVLVGHSLGGAYARRFAQLFPEDVAGIVMLDAFYEEWDTYMPESMHLARARHPRPGRLSMRLIRLFTRRVYGRMLAEWPPELRTTLVDHHASPEWILAGMEERKGLVELRDELQAAGKVPDVPLIALTALSVDAGQALLMSKKAMRAQSEAKRRLYQALADSTAHGEHRALEGAGHSTIHTDRADAVVKAVRDVWDRATT
ncbi:alpha/beta fold hydrolase [Nonomuraea sp. NPDC002799]